MNQDQIKVEETLLSLIDLYNKEDKKDREYFLKYRKNNPDSGLQKEPFTSFYKIFEPRVSHSEITDFLYYFGDIRLLKTFHFSHHAESFVESFGKLGLPIPQFVLECQKEVIHREDFIKNYFEKEKFKWENSQREGFLSEIQKEAKNHSFDPKSEQEYLKAKFKETIQEVRIIEQKITSRYEYLVENFFDGETFKPSKDELNEYFYHCEIASGGYGSFFEIFVILNRFVQKKNELFSLRGFLSGRKEEGIENNEVIENTFNSIPIEQVKDHFILLTKRKNKKGEIWMTEKEFDTFLKRSFGGQTQLSKPKINIGHGDKFAVVKLFHSFFNECRNHPYNEPNRKDKVLNLLKNAFDNPIFSDLRKDNFKADKSKTYNWD